MLHEIPLPVPSISFGGLNPAGPAGDAGIGGIVIETKDKCAGEIEIRNAGGGVLEGRLVSRMPELSFDEPGFRGNRKKIGFKVNAQQSGIKPGQSKRGHFMAVTNGGELTVPVTLKYVKMSIAAPSGASVSSVADFYEYYLASPAGAKKMFTDSEFYMLLLATGYPYLEVYESLHKDANRERALDNFFVLSGLKEETTVLPRQRRLEFCAHSDEPLRGRFEAEKSDGGFAQTEIQKRGQAEWLNIATGRLSTADFGEAKEARLATVNFSIEPKKISGGFAREEIIVGPRPLPGKANVVEVLFRRAMPVEARLLRETYQFEDRGALAIANSTGQTVTVEPFCKDSYIRFAAKRFVVGEYEEIPFDVRLTGLMNAQVYLRKIAYLRTSIEVKFVLPGRAHKASLGVAVGGW